MIKRGVLISSVFLIIILAGLAAAQENSDDVQKNIFQQFMDWIFNQVRFGPKRGAGDSLIQYRVFVSSVNYTGGQLSNGDSKCQQLAQQAGLTGTWKAWLSTSSKDAKGKIEDAKYVRIDGATVANSKADLLDGSLQNPINVNEYGIELPLSICDSPTCDLAYTGTNVDGTRSPGFMCNDWTSESADGKVGYFPSITGEWTAVGNVSCSSKQRIYCFEVATTGKIVANNSNPTQKTHLACSNLACTSVPGAGPNTCATNADCSHLACLSNSCSLAAGAGTNECSPAGSSCGSNVIEVCTPQDLDNVRNNLNGNYLQVCDINLAGYNFEPIGIYSNGEILPFTGRYDGQMYKISNWTYNNASRDYVGLFGVLSNSAFIEKLTLINVNLVGDEFVGAISGSNGGIIRYATASKGQISGRRVVGGVVGSNGNGISNSGKIQKSISDLDSVKEYSSQVGGFAGQVGGFVGENLDGGEIELSSSASPVYGLYVVGGFVGENLGSIIDSNSYGHVRFIDNPNTTTNPSHAGGFVGTNLGNSIIKKSNSYGTVFYQGKYIVGGFAGRNAYSAQILDSYAAGDVYGGSDVGGFVGIDESTTLLSRVYARGVVNGTDYSRTGGLIGYRDPSAQVIKSYWDTDVSGLTSSAGGTGKRTNDMKNKTTYEQWDFQNTWKIYDERSYPYLDGEFFDDELGPYYLFDNINNGGLTPDISHYGVSGLVNGVGVFNSIRGKVFGFNNGDFVRIISGESETNYNRFTLGSWIKLDKNTNETGQPVQTIFSEGYPGFYPPVMLFVNQNNKVVFKFHYANNATALFSVTSTTPLQKGVWYQITAVMGDDKLKIYMNGVLNNQISFPSSYAAYSTNIQDSAFIGADNGGTRWYLYGSLDNFYFNSELNEAGIKHYMERYDPICIDC